MRFLTRDYLIFFGRKRTLNLRQKLWLIELC